MAEPGPSNTEAELESFRKQWQEEVRRGKTRKFPQNQGQSNIARQITQASASKKSAKAKPAASTSAGAVNEESAAQSYHDLDNKEDALKLDASPEARKAVVAPSEPSTALDHYERAVERETAGNLGDSVSLYRTAFKLDPNVHDVYKKKHFPAPPKPTSSTTAHKSSKSQDTLIVGNPEQTGTTEPLHVPPTTSSSLNDLLDAISNINITPTEPIIENTPPPPCPIARLPVEVILRIINFAAALDDAAYLARLSLVCKLFAYLITTEDSIWKPICLSPFTGFRGMHYRYTMTLPGYATSLTAIDPHSITPLQIPDLTPSVYPSHRAQFRHRPRLRFGGCYISTVNYTRPGAMPQDRRSYSSPVHIVTYYRYLRFYRDGSCISLLTTAEPADVVHYLNKSNLEDEKRRERERGGAATANLPSVVMREALRGRWRMTGPCSGPSPRLEDEDEPLGKRPGEYAKEPVSIFEGSLADDEEEAESEGTVHVETEGVVEKYLWTMEFMLGSSGRKDGVRNNRLTWRSFWSYNRLTDDWGEFGLRNDKAFYWSRVKSYGSGG